MENQTAANETNEATAANQPGLFAKMGAFIWSKKGVIGTVVAVGAAGFAGYKVGMKKGSGNCPILGDAGEPGSTAL